LIKTGKVGTGFTDRQREEIFNNPKDYIKRMIQIRSEQQYPSGAYRAPAYDGPVN